MQEWFNDIAAQGQTKLGLVYYNAVLLCRIKYNLSFQADDCSHFSFTLYYSVILGDLQRVI